MFETGSTKSMFRKMLPRVVKAIVKGLLGFIVLYALFTFLISSLSGLVPSIFGSYWLFSDMYIVVFVFFVVISELTSGTIFQHAFNIGKALILMMLIVYALSGGVVTLDFENIHVIADLRIYLVMILTIDFIGLAKSVLRAVNFQSETAEKQLPAPLPN